jgi:hypothetical protein
VSSTPGGIFGYRIISTHGELEASSSYDTHVSSSSYDYRIISTHGELEGTVSFEESSVSPASVEEEEDVISQRENKEAGGGSGNEGGLVDQQQQQQHDPEKTTGDGVEAEEGKATEAVVQSPEALAGQKIACSPLHSFLEAKVETECIGRGGEGAGRRSEGRFAQMDVTLDALGNKEGTPARAGSMEEEGKESAFTFDVDSQTLVKENCYRRERDLL